MHKTSSCPFQTPLLLFLQSRNQSWLHKGMGNNCTDVSRPIGPLWEGHGPEFHSLSCLHEPCSNERYSGILDFLLSESTVILCLIASWMVWEFFFPQYILILVTSFRVPWAVGNSYHVFTVVFQDTSLRGSSLLISRWALDLRLSSDSENWLRPRKWVSVWFSYCSDWQQFFACWISTSGYTDET